MKTFLLIIVSLLCSTFTTNDPKRIKVKDVRYVKDWETKSQLSNFKNKDIEVYRVNVPGGGYLTRVYREENSAIKCNRGPIYGTDKDYEYAEYKWINDSLVGVTLFSKSNRDTEEYYINDRAGSITGGS
ncbi:hypothetical protein LZZ90_09285 [Flavobacterium sp. SM15]|uniref:hypothetical protein n=1 Tax=Flavobacterium sp. SM15 TaxID=2908005 RepID=UPI001EDA2530|nr:hypothetical protein [Flavobacterium sp. SM15]MCG2611699.1 hypothetical protein [Flavobacterium sp. SM15]